MSVTFLGAFLGFFVKLLWESGGGHEADGDPPPTAVSHHPLPAQLSKATPSHPLSPPLKQAESKLQIITPGMSHYINRFFKITEWFKSLVMGKKKKKLKK